MNTDQILSIVSLIWSLAALILSVRNLLLLHKWEQGQNKTDDRHKGMQDK